MTAIASEDVKANRVGAPISGRSREPNAFHALRKEELLVLADHFGTETEGTSKALVLDLVDHGVTWNMAASVLGFKEEPEEKVVLKSDIFKPNTIKEGKTEPESDVVLASEPETLKPSAKYLIKMERENPYFEWRSYKFTAEKPFAIMTSEDAQDILTSEENFRQAYPDELSEYYG